MQNIFDENYLLKYLKEELTKTQNSILQLSQKKINSIKIDETNKELTINVNTKLCYDNLNSNKKIITDILNNITEKKFKISISLSSNKENNNITNIKDNIDKNTKKTINENSKNLKIEENKNNKETKINKISTEIPYLNPIYTLDNFIVGENSEFAYNIAKAISSNPGGIYNPFFVYSNVGLGKTHLVEAIGNEVKKNFPNYKVLYTTCEYFTRQYVESVANKNINECKSIYRNTDVLIIDDIQFLEKKEGTLHYLFDIFNSLKEANRQMIFTSDQPATAKVFGERISTRLESGATADLQVPTFEVRVAILKKKCEIEKIHISDDIIFCLAEKITSNIRDLNGALNNIIIYQRFKNSELKIKDIEKILKNSKINIKNYNLEKITPDLIIEKVAKEFDVSKQDIKGIKSTNKLVLPRQISMYLISTYINNISLSEIGELFSGKKHASVIYSKNRINKLIKEDKAILEKIKNIKTALKIK